MIESEGGAGRPPGPLRPLNFTGLVVGLVFLSWSLTPSLVPRSWVLQGVASGTLTALGYGIGVLASHLVRRLVPREPGPRVKRLAWRVLAVVGPLVAITFLVLGATWQREIHLLVGLEEQPTFSYVGTALITVVVMLSLVFLGRGLRWISRRVAEPLQRWFPPRFAGPVGAAVVALLVVGVLDGVVVRALISAADDVSKTVDAAMTDEVPPPSGDTRSGGPGSLLDWEELGSKGRAFVTGGPTVAELASFTQRDVAAPVRIYTGLESAEDDRDRAALAVADLERAGGFERSVLCVIVPTGTGWIDPLAADALEYLHAGDTALVSMQYSYLPSWLSYLVDLDRAREAGRVLLEEVHDRWSELPEEDRPELVVHGESLGSHGSEAAFSGLGDLRSRVDGALWIGPPNFNALWRDLTARRDPGTPQWLPIVERGRTVRFASTPQHLERPRGEWERPRVVYLQNASDPVVWWSPNLILRQPDWLREPRGEGVHPSVRWFPFVTFTQVTVDLMYDASLVEVPHGHRYGAVIGDAWAAIVPPDDWSADDMARLRDVLAAAPAR